MSAKEFSKIDQHLIHKLDGGLDFQRSPYIFVWSKSRLSVLPVRVTLYGRSRSENDLYTSGRRFALGSIFTPGSPVAIWLNASNALAPSSEVIFHVHLATTSAAVLMQLAATGK